jgi:hypothetical protein
MRKYLAALATAAALSLGLMSVPAHATVGTAPGIQQSLSRTSIIEQARRVCRRNMWTGRRECWTDRSQPPTVCHRIRGTNRLDCY